MEIALVCVVLYLVVGFIVADFTSPGDGTGYLYIVLLWGIFVPVALFKAVMEHDEEDEDD